MNILIFRRNINISFRYTVDESKYSCFFGDKIYTYVIIISTLALTCQHIHSRAQLHMDIDIDI